MYLLSIILSVFVSWGFGGASSTAPSTPHPADHCDLVLFVLGGVSALEVQQLQSQLSAVSRAAEEAGTCELEGGELLRVFVGSTAVLGPEDVFRQVFVRMRREPLAE